MNQTRLESFIESSINIGSGFVVSLLFWTFVVVPVWHLPVSMHNNLQNALAIAIFSFMGMRRAGQIQRFIEIWKNSGKSHWRHGTRHGYEKGCRCVLCRAAHAKRFRQRRARLREAQAIRQQAASVA